MLFKIKNHSKDISLFIGSDIINLQTGSTAEYDTIARSATDLPHLRNDDFRTFEYANSRLTTNVSLRLTHYLNAFKIVGQTLNIK